MNTVAEFAQGVVKAVDKERLSNREKMLAATAVVAAWTALALAGHVSFEPLIATYQMILGGLGVGGAMAWQPRS